MNLVTRGADALVLCGVGQAPELLQVLRQRELPTVHAMSYPAPAGLVCVGFDNARAIGQGVRYLLDLGAPAPWPGESPADWVDRALAEGPFRRFRHPGNLAYGWPLWGGVELAEAHPYTTSEDVTP